MKRIVGILIFVVAYCLSSAGLSAVETRHYGFKHIGSDDGISASYVKAIVQDSNGFIWVGTKNGLDRYDGISVRTFCCRDDKVARGNNNISAIISVH